MLTYFKTKLLKQQSAFGVVSKMFSSKAISGQKKQFPQSPQLSGNLENLFQEELMFLEESYSNLVADLRQCQKSNYVLTGELSRSQELNMNLTDELHACQHANTILRGELQRLEVENLYLNDSIKLYEKQGKIWKADKKRLKDSLSQHKKITAYITNKFETLKEKIDDPSRSNLLNTVDDIINLMKSYTEENSQENSTAIKEYQLKNETSANSNHFSTISEVETLPNTEYKTDAILPDVNVTIATDDADLTQNKDLNNNSIKNSIAVQKSPQLVRFDQNPKLYQYNKTHADCSSKDQDKSPRTQRTQSPKNIWEV
ncbi:uncharacterized protein LOC105843691 isoform X2 [Hydra vulgaris]|uniref:Uncharacterized protein LOC105843691 isoform X2 n=1 Tax=Hydra vulgaris TaxID=6087 RepID=A0ABM4CKE6_HYDVU